MWQLELVWELQMNIEKSHQGKYSAQTFSVVEFLNFYSQLYELSCTTDIRRSNGEPVLQLPLDTIKEDLFTEYK